MDLSFVCTICFSPYGHLFGSSSFQEVCLLHPGTGLGVFRDSVHLLSAFPLFFPATESYGQALSHDNVRNTESNSARRHPDCH